MHFHQILITNFELIFMALMMQFNDNLFLPIIAYSKPYELFMFLWWYEMKILWKNNFKT
jgi:hypothetical protein